tara:strand:- start:2434 stop:3264 length:831 start_codon:yes stop_codon:yes gene_type:complete
MNDEFIYAISNSELSENTMMTYASNYKRLMRLLKDEPILCFQESRIIKKMKEFVDVPPMSINGMLSVVYLVRKSVHLTTSKLDKYREFLMKENKKHKAESKERILLDKLVSIEALHNHIKTALEDKDYKKYIVNFLMVRFGLRNLDLKLHIVNDKNIFKDDTTANYIYLTEKYAVYTIQNYKTRDTYGIKQFKIYDKEFTDVCRLLLKETDDYELIDNNNHNRFIQQRTINEVGEGVVFKSLVREYATNGDIDSIKKLGLSRGTEMNCIMEEYHIQ